MTLRELLKKAGISSADMDKPILFSCDEELNRLYREAEICEDPDTGELILFPLSGTEKGD